MVTKTVQKSDDDVVYNACHEFVEKTGDCNTASVLKGLICLVGSWLVALGKPQLINATLGLFIKRLKEGIESHQKEGGL